MGRRIMLSIGRGILRLVDDTAGLQIVQVSLLAEETRGQVERVQQYGLTSHPLPGADVVLLAIGGSRDHPVAAAIDDRRHRLTGLQPGEVALYTDEGDSVVLKRGRIVEITAGARLRIASPLVEIDSPRVEITGDLVDQLGGDNELTVREMRDIYNGHRHGGVQSGSSQTATPEAQM
jgi:phage baseplate assembly protein V